ncbi:transglutaminase domain-containing protein [Aquimarina sp. 2201CG5-10]|uniref:transglutaminase-like domain-containing protein n=1 Tax=Aquimarina callyspongiae TaxID=3098150 RepID=UPI002AB56A8F|nr:transglutaminase domain-containing protein [Aquimarina sp. 2201CG5-10]MDY8138955.1 transglutaminase domain-containing protein [Aquimarina sp. 2201CG5-10]
MIQKLNLLVFILIGTLSFSQKKVDPTPEDIQLSKELKEKYSEADIAILSSTEEITFSYDKKTKKVTVNHTHLQELINLDSRSTIPLFIFYDDQSSINKLKVSYRNNKGAGIYFKDEYYNDDDLFHTDARVKWTSLSFPLRGYKYNFEYAKKYNDIKYFINSYFDDVHPTIKKTIKVQVPDWLDLEIQEINFNGTSITKNETRDDENQITTFTYTIEKIDAISKDKNKPGPTYYRPHLLFLAKSHSSNGKKTTLLNNTADLYKWYHSLVLQLDNNTESIKEKTLSLIKDCKTDEEKMKAIYYWVQDNIRYIAFEDGIAGFKPDEAQNVYKKKYGDCKGMANLTKQMLKIAGFDARLTWIGTKRIAYDYSLPTIAVDNHMICTVLLNDQKYYLDSTEKYNPLEYNAERIQNQQVLIEDGENYILDQIPEMKSDLNLETLSANFEISDEELIGDISRNYNGESKSYFLYNINNLRTDRREETLDWYIRRDDKNVTAQDISVTDITDRDGDLNLSYKINQKNAVSAFDNELYIDIDYYKEYKNLDLKKREIDYIFPYKILEKTNINLKIPDNYKIKELPEDLVIKNSDFEISFTYKTEGDIIKYQKIIHFKNAKISSSEIDLWRDFHNNLKEQYQKQIILSKD